MSSQVLHRPIKPGQYPAYAQTSCPDLLQSYKGVFPDAQPREIDFEDWAENTAMLFAMQDAAQNAGLPFMLIENKSTAMHMHGGGFHAPSSVPDAPCTAMWGVFKPSDAIEFPVPVNMIGNSRASASRVALWAKQPTFLERAGRAIHLVDMDIDAVWGAMANLKAQGANRAFIKTTQKSWNMLCDIADDVPENIAWDIVAHEGAKDAVIVQGVIEPTFEYRMFVVGDRVVTGAGCIEHFTPVDAIHGVIFDGRMEAYRNTSRVSVELALLDRYRDFAQSFAREWADKVSGSDAYTLDLAYNALTGEIVPIELNPMLNTGLYASCPQALATALVDLCQTAERACARAAKVI